MNISLKSAALAVSTAGQIAILIGMYLLAALPLWTGTEIKVRTVPVDPRSLFRGNYARLSYDFSIIERRYFESPETLRTGEVVYVSLKPDAIGAYMFSEVSTTEPVSGIFLRGRIQAHSWRADEFRIHYGIEAFFAPKEEALELEKQLRQGGVAVLMVSGDGKARLKAVEAS